MNKLFVKICGITRRQDAELAAGLGASALGFVFWPDSPRFVTAEAARDMAAGVPAHVIKVGVFVDQPAEEVVRIMDEAELDVAQLHGKETAEYCRELMIRLGPTVRLRPEAAGTVRPAADARTAIFKAVTLESGGARMGDFDRDVVLLVDAHDPVRVGGTGRTANWDSARELAAARPTILAGGLNAANIKLAVRSVRPYGVDVSSGVESAPGVKDPNRLRTFFEALYD
jgi:phosphoribosylanthranilate isomerase